MKECRRCLRWKHATTEFYYKNKQSKDGLHDYCKECKSKIHKVYLSNPNVYKRVVNKIKEWQKGIGKDKYIAITKRYDSSKKRVISRRKRDKAKPRFFKNREVIFPDINFSVKES